jgi:hypothetical protein
VTDEVAGPFAQQSKVEVRHICDREGFADYIGSAADEPRKQRAQTVRLTVRIDVRKTKTAYQGLI